MSGKGVLWAIIWFFVLILIAWPIGFFCAGWYVCLSPFEACIDAMKSVTSLLMSGVTFPFHVTNRMIKGQSYSKIWRFETIIDHIQYYAQWNMIYIFCSAKTWFLQKDSMNSLRKYRDRVTSTNKEITAVFSYLMKKIIHLFSSVQFDLFELTQATVLYLVGFLNSIKLNLRIEFDWVRFPNNRLTKCQVFNYNEPAPVAWQQIQKTSKASWVCTINLSNVFDLKVI